MRPVELSEPKRETSEVTTEQFDVDEELSRLDEMTGKNQESESTPEKASDNDRLKQGSDSTGSESGETGFLTRIVQWFKD